MKKKKKMGQVKNGASLPDNNVQHKLWVMRPPDAPTDSILPQHRPSTSLFSVSSLQHPSPNDVFSFFPFPSWPFLLCPPTSASSAAALSNSVPPSQAGVLQPARRGIVSSRVPVQASGSAGYGRAKTKGKKNHYWNRMEARARSDTAPAGARHCLRRASSWRGTCFSSS